MEGGGGSARRRSTATPLVVGVTAGGAVALALGLMFIGRVETRLLRTGAVGDAVKQAWRERTHGVSALSGREAAALAAEAPRHSRPLAEMERLGREGRVLQRAMYGPVSRRDIASQIERELRPFVNSERVFLDRITPILGSASEESVASKLRVIRSAFLATVVSVVVLADLLALGIDQSLFFADQVPALLQQRKEQLAAAAAATEAPAVR
jgi:hypothetical protein